MLTATQVQLVQKSWRQVLPISGMAAEVLMPMIGTAVNGLSRRDTTVPAVQELGRRHMRYGVLAKTMKDAAAQPS